MDDIEDAQEVADIPSAPEDSPEVPTKGEEVATRPKAENESSKDPPGSDQGDDTADPKPASYEDDYDGYLSDLERDLRADLRGPFVEAPSLYTGKVGFRRRNRQALSYFVLVEARIKDLEHKLKDWRPPEKPAAESEHNAEAEQEKAPPEPSEDDKWDLSPVWRSLQEFLERPLEVQYPQPIIEVLAEPMGPIPGRKGDKIPLEDVRKGPVAKLLLDRFPKHEVHRIRINSPYICDIISSVMEARSGPSPGRTHIHPFKVFLAYEKNLRAKLVELEEKANPQPHSELDSRNMDAEASPGNGSRRGSLPANSDDRLDQIQVDQSIKHLKALITFLDEHMHQELASYRRLRSREISSETPKVTFQELWKLFAPGDIIFHPATRQASRVIRVLGGRRKLRNRHVDSDSEDDEGIVSVFTIVCFFLDFNGDEVGPVQVSWDIRPFERSKPVTDLDVYPIEYVNATTDLRGHLEAAQPTARGKTIAQLLTERGQRFSQLATTTTVAHKDYDGLSLDPVQEQIDSEVIIDLDKFYLLEPHRRPSLGFRDIDEPDWRETSESCRRHCTAHDDCGEIEEESIKLYNDHEVDSDLRDKAMQDKDMQNLVKWRSGDQEAIREKYPILFPRQIEGFVFKNRDWHTLNIEYMSDLQHGKQSFDDLILPPQHKMIVQSLVDSHALGSKPVKGTNAAKPDIHRTREDLVRGKGKGLIVLLHGVPGVGKTSTAECVAEYTKRPLYALTCGDIGEEPAEVQRNLKEAFSLAYRWGCVMLLDEADVFLAARNKTDLKRNAVVSVFLRTLEYYSGILFLTTNKVGVFDEAFKSRIHISLYYKPLTWDQTEKIWAVNLGRIREVKKDLTFDQDSLLKWVRKAWKKAEKEDPPRRPWNGRQIHNAVRTAAALAAFQNGNILTADQLKAVDKASKQFDKYLDFMHGTDSIGLAERNFDRADDDKYADEIRFHSAAIAPSKSRPTPEKHSRSSKKSKKRAPTPSPEGSEESGSSSSEDSD